MTSGRFLFPLLILGLVAATGKVDAVEMVSPPVDGSSPVVSQPHATAQLIPEKTTIAPGQPFDIAVHLHADPDWHTYWINPGDAGIPTTIKWTLPAGFTAGPIQWPTPELHAMGPIVTFGYGDDVDLLVTITPPATGLDPHPVLKARVQWLVCKEECVPGKADLEITLDSNPLNFRLPVDNHALFDRARARLPAVNTRWDVTGSEQEGSVVLRLKEKIETRSANAGHLYFFPEQSNILSALPADQAWTQSPGLSGVIKLQQNGGAVAQLGGVLVSDTELIDHAKAVYLPAFQVGPAVSGGAQDGRPSPGTAAKPLLLAVLGAAFLGGLILNLMPCVLPVLSLKVFSLVRHAGENSRAAWVQGVAFTAGVVVSFWILAGLLIALRAFGHELGWGFQMQSPGFVLGLTFLFFFLALNLFGVFEFGTSLVGLDARASGKLHGTASSFANGVLATLAATPCTAPFMGSSLGFAAQQPPFVALLIFTFLALGMATPYLLLTLFPAALRFVPKPGVWMETFKQCMGFLLLATVIFLVYVFSALTGPAQVPLLLAALLLFSVAWWIQGRYALATGRARVAAIFLTLLFLLLAGHEAIPLAWARPAPAALSTDAGWQPWSPEAVQAGVAANRPVFVDFTAAWCLSCKVNEQVALENDAVKKALADKNVLLLKGDWTRSDPAITQILQHYNRDGVPLYLLYSPKVKDAPQMLPELLTPGIVLQALKAVE